jgi:hypothetical protein
MCECVRAANVVLLTLSRTPSPHSLTHTYTQHHDTMTDHDDHDGTMEHNDKNFATWQPRAKKKGSMFAPIGRVGRCVLCNI